MNDATISKAKPKIGVSYNKDVGGQMAQEVKEKLGNLDSVVCDIDFESIVPSSLFAVTKITDTLIEKAKVKAKKLLSDVDALIIPGNNLAVSPVIASLFGGEASSEDYSSLERSLAEAIMVELAINKGMPIMGICGGHQLIHAYLGGKVENNQFPHIHNAIVIEPNSELAEIIKRTSIPQIDKQNFYGLHGDIVTRIGGKKTIGGDLFKVVARALGDVIEATESQFGSPITTFQFHPEMHMRDAKDNQRNDKIFVAFIKSAESYMSKRKMLEEVKESVKNINATNSANQPSRIKRNIQLKQKNNNCAPSKNLHS